MTVDLNPHDDAPTVAYQFAGAGAGAPDPAPAPPAAPRRAGAAPSAEPDI
ncbi:hypothetical protein [Frankia sp. AiPa1]|nr:hypothetical protein [Frankia sp. AiPa1]MCL9761176.1 hypothetical protein [Frankia sp. AiPa1]